MTLVSDILGAVEYIEANLSAPLALEGIAARCHLSKFHFSRVFKALTGMTAADYVWKRRLAESLSRLSDTRDSVTQIALDAAFSDSASYAHAFQKCFGVSPTGYRKAPGALPVTERLQPSHFTGNDLGLLMRPEAVFLPGLTAIGERHKIRYGENREKNAAYLAGSAFYTAWRDRIPGAKDPGMYTGITMIPKGEDYTWYFPALEVEPDTRAPAGLAKIILPAGQYARFRYAGMHDVSALSANMRPLFEDIYLAWMPSLCGTAVP